MAPDLLTAYEVPGFVDFALNLFGFVPVGFLLGCFLGLLSFGVFGALRLLRRLIHR